MGKWSTYAKRGSSIGTGYLLQPDAADFNLNTVTATSVTVSFTGSFPSRITTYRVAYKRTDTDVMAIGNAGANNVVQGSLATGVEYEIFVAWARAGIIAVSPWQSVGTVTPT